MARSAHGFSLTELMMVIAIAGTVMVISVPVVTDLSAGAKLNGASLEVERELQSARLKAVTVNRLLRVRLNCPAEGSYRTVEVIDDFRNRDPNRCLLTAYPYPAADTDVVTRPNHDGPLRFLPSNTTVSSSIIEFRPDGTAVEIVADAPREITSPLTITVSRYDKYRSITINAAGKISLTR